MTWEIVVGIITLITVGISVGKLISNNTKTMTELRCSIDELNHSLKTLQSDLYELKAKIADFELRLTKIEVREEMLNQ